MSENQAIQIIKDRMNAMLQVAAINQKYQSFSSQEEAEKWIFGAAVATLMGVGNE